MFERIADTLQSAAWSVIPDALPLELATSLAEQLQPGTRDLFSAAGIGRQQDHKLAPDIRRDAICWIEGRTHAEEAWLTWAEALRKFLNRRSFMGLDNFESHFAHYAPGAFYKKHLDAFRNAPVLESSNRFLSVVAYFNKDWREEDGGELDLFDESGEQLLQTVLPQFGTLVVFLSEEVPHGVRAAQRDRYSIAGWYRVRATDFPLE